MCIHPNNIEYTSPQTTVKAVTWKSEYHIQLCGSVPISSFTPQRTHAHVPSHAHVPLRHLYIPVRFFGLLQYTSTITISKEWSSTQSDTYGSVGVPAYVLMYPATRAQAPVYHLYTEVRSLWLLSCSTTILTLKQTSGIQNQKKSDNFNFTEPSPCQGARIADGSKGIYTQVPWLSLHYWDEVYLASPYWYVEGTGCEDFLTQVECIIGVPVQRDKSSQPELRL